jgi:hypothetical protein
MNVESVIVTVPRTVSHRELSMLLHTGRDDHTDNTRYQLHRDGRRAERFTIGLDRLWLPDAFDADALAHGQGAESRFSLPRPAHELPEQAQVIW